MNDNGAPRFHVTAEYPSMPAARRAIEALQYDGVEATRISLAGPAVEEARQADSEPNSLRRDEPIVWHIVLRAVWWSIVGGVAGALVGLIAAAIGFDFGVGGPPIQIAGWAMFGHVAGGLWGAYAALTSGDAWELTFQPTQGAVIVSVRADNRREIDRCLHIMREKQPVRVGVQAEEALPA